MMMNKGTAMTDTVTFTTVLVPSQETPKAYKILGQRFLPKSQVQATVTLERYESRGRNRWGKELPPILVQVAEVTMPRWLAEKG